MLGEIPRPIPDSVPERRVLPPSKLKRIVASLNSRAQEVGDIRSPLVYVPTPFSDDLWPSVRIPVVVSVTPSEPRFDPESLNQLMDVISQPWLDAGLLNEPVNLTTARFLDLDKEGRMSLPWMKIYEYIGDRVTTLKVDDASELDPNLPRDGTRVTLDRYTSIVLYPSDEVAHAAHRHVFKIPGDQLEQQFVMTAKEIRRFSRRSAA